MTNIDHTPKRKKEISFSCEGKCRICPYPGANCKTITLTPNIPERETDPHRVWMDPALQEKLMKEHCLK